MVFDLVYALSMVYVDHIVNVFYAVNIWNIVKYAYE